MNSWLIQRGTFQRRENKIGIDHIISLDYMGSAEYEFGAIPKSFKRILENINQYDIITTNFKNVNNIPLNIFCKTDDKKEVLEIIDKLSIDYIRLKEWITFQWNFKRSEHSWNKPKENFWWDIQNDFMFFFGFDDRIKLFKDAIQENVKDYQEKIAV